MKFWEKSKESIFVYRGMNSVNSTNALNIILSPEFYWLKTEKLPVKFSFMAKKYAPSLFEGMLPDVKHSFVVEKRDDEFLFIAYDESEVAQFLQSIGIKKEHISKIYFAQCERGFIKDPIYLDDKLALIELNSVVTILKKELVSSDIRLYPQNRDYKPVGISADWSRSGFLTNTQIYAFSIFLLLFATLNFVEAFSYRFETQKLKQNLQNFISDSKLPTSSYRLDSIYSKYSKLDSTQRRKRDITTQLIQIINKNRGEIVSFELDKKGVFIKAKAKLNQINSIKRRVSKLTYIKSSTIKSPYITVKAGLK